MKKMISVKLQGTGEAAGYKVYHANGVCIGDFLMSPDGYYDWWPVPERDGSFPAYILRAMADELDKLNKDWDEEVQKATFNSYELPEPEV